VGFGLPLPQKKKMTHALTQVFYFIKPTPANLAAYERWSGTEAQGHTWLGDMVDEVMKVTLVEGNTMIIPTGWIHAVASSFLPIQSPQKLLKFFFFQYTPVDTLVFGGNFLHSYNVATRKILLQLIKASDLSKEIQSFECEK
jgi:F-box and leucine-rich repeat protein 10/11